jgi:hypothetical protein
MRLNSFSADTFLVALHTPSMRHREIRRPLYFSIGLPPARVHHPLEEAANPTSFEIPNDSGMSDPSRQVAT